MITIDEWEFELIKEFREGFNEEALLARYSDVLLKYDYILGDWGYGQLRLKGFFDDRNQKATYETKISTIQDYLYEYCNFGCAYFVLQKKDKVKVVEVVEEIPEEIVQVSKVSEELVQVAPTELIVEETTEMASQE
jgi:uncharacterized protein YutD